MDEVELTDVVELLREGPSIDYVQEIIDQIANRGDDWAEKQSDVVKDVLEYVRASNDELRESSKYWYKKYKEAA